jgi:hypothetical protein
MSIVKLYYNVHLTLYNEKDPEIVEEHILKSYENFITEFIDFMNKNKNVWFRNLIDVSAIEPDEFVKNIFFSFSDDSLCFTIEIDNNENAEDLLECTIDDENEFYDTWASCPAWGENKFDISSSEFYDIFLIPIKKTIEYS